MDDSKFKFTYSILLLLLTIGWAGFCVWATYRAMDTLKDGDIIMAAGTGVLLGALINWTGNVNQYWFRKAKGKENNDKR